MELDKKNIEIQKIKTENSSLIVRIKNSKK